MPENNMKAYLPVDYFRYTGYLPQDNRFNEELAYGSKPPQKDD